MYGLVLSWNCVSRLDVGEVPTPLRLGPPRARNANSVRAFRKHRRDHGLQFAFHEFHEFHLTYVWWNEWNETKRGFQGTAAPGIANDSRACSNFLRALDMYR